ncbi:MAG: hypothetical protein ACJ8R9_22165 [Steroidobacteraceae bacterium]
MSFTRGRLIRHLLVIFLAGSVAPADSNTPQYSFLTTDGELVFRFPSSPSLDRDLNITVEKSPCSNARYTAKGKGYLFGAIILDCPAYDMAAHSDEVFKQMDDMFRQMDTPIFGHDDKLHDIAGSKVKAKEVLGRKGEIRAHNRIFVRAHSTVTLSALWDSRDPALAAAAIVFLNSMTQ